MEWLQNLPMLHVIDERKLVLVHAGLWPRISLFRQPDNICRAQQIHPRAYGETRWWGHKAVDHKCKTTEKESRKLGWKRWYELFDWDYDVVFGHSVFKEPLIYKTMGGGRAIGIDQGCVFGGMLTAAIIDGSDVHFEYIPARDSYNKIEYVWDILKEAHKDYDVILPCMGLPSRVLNKRLFKINYKGISIDFGSIVDSEANIATRSWIKLFNTKNILDEV